MDLIRMRHVLLVATLLGVVACATHIGDFTIVSTKNYEASQKYHLVGRKSGPSAEESTAVNIQGSTWTQSFVDENGEFGPRGQIVTVIMHKI